MKWSDPLDLISTVGIKRGGEDVTDTVADGGAIAGLGCTSLEFVKSVTPATVGHGKSSGT